MPAPWRNIDYSPSEGVARSKVLEGPFAEVPFAGSKWTHFPRVKKAGHTDGRAPPMRVSAIDMSAQYAIDMSARGAIDSYA